VRKSVIAIATPLAIGIAYLSFAGAGASLSAAGTEISLDGPLSATTPALNVNQTPITLAKKSLSTTLAAHPVTGQIPFTGDAKAKARVAKLAKAQAKKVAAAKERARLAKISRNFTRPVANYRLSAGFYSYSRLWASHRHTGQDFVAAYGSPVRAAQSGTVIFAGWDGSYGRKVEIQHANGIQTWYGHMSKIKVHVGQKVSVGTTIGRVGNTGHVTGTHLHFEVRRYGVPINPVKWLRSMGIYV